MPETIVMRFVNPDDPENRRVESADPRRGELVRAAVGQFQIHSDGFSLGSGYAGDIVDCLLQSGRRVVFEPRGGAGEPETPEPTDLETAASRLKEIEDDLARAQIAVLTAIADAGKSGVYRNELACVVRTSLGRLNAVTRKD